MHNTQHSEDRSRPDPARRAGRRRTAGLAGLAGALLAVAALPLAAAPPLVGSRYLNPVWPDETVTNASWWTNYAPLAGFSAVGGFTATNSAGPATGNLVIAESSFGEGIVGIGANFQLGDPLTPPSGTDSNVAPELDFLGGPTNSVWLDYAGRLIAIDMGAVQVSWTLLNGSTQTLTYTISPSPTRRPVRLYWTEGQNAGPTIPFASTYRVDIFYNSQIRSTNDVWIDANQLHAAPSCGSGGRFLLTYSRVDEASGRRELLAYEIVEVLEPMSSIQRANVGDRLLPQDRPYSTENLFASVTRGILDPAGLETPFVYQHTEGAQKGWVWAIRETKADEAWRIEIYWKAKEELDVLWPFEVDIYHVTWSATAQRFVRGAPGDAEPKVYFPSEILTELMPHFSPPTHQPILENGVFSSVNTGYCLLRYTADQRVWFEPVRSVERTEAPGYTNPINAEIGAELRPVDGGGQPLEAEYGEWPGYLYTNAGTVYNLGKYQYPSSYLDPATIESYVFPVNRGNLEVWWANRSRQAELPQPIFFPSRVNRYVCDWPTHPQEITIASGVGNQGYTEDRNTACIRFDRGSLSLEEAQALSCHLRLDNPNSLNIANELTLELWVKPASAVGMQYLVDKGVNFRLRLNGGVPELYVGGRWYRAAAGVTAGVWQHLAVTVADRGRVAFYRDGHDIGAASFIGSLSPQAVPLRVGAWASDGVTPEDFYTGYLDELRIWAVARTKEQIRTDLNVSVDAGSAGLRARYRFNSADRVLDTSHFGNHIELPPAGVSFAFPGVPQVLPGTDLAGVDIGLYVQNDRTRHGFNPNEEHAIIFQSVVYALRCDLNVTSGVTRTSEPYVLIDCRTPLVNNNRPYMNVFRVVPTNSFYSFSRFLTAGLMIQPPAPIALMNPSNCSSNDQVAGPEFRDRKGYYWARQAGDEGGTTNYVFDFYYPMQSDFVFPQRLVQPAAGAQIGWLDVFSGDGTPVDFTFVVEWPEDAPVLHIGDTLTVAKDGLPAIRGQLSVEVPYQQSVARSGRPSVTLIDPTIARGVPFTDMALITDRMKSYRDVRTACWHLSDLSPALRNRLFYNPNADSNQALQLTGEYRTRTDNQNYLLLNLLAGANRASTTNETLVRGITGAGGNAWRGAIALMPSTVVEVVSPDTPFDSLALPTTGRGTGYVTVVFNNSTNDALVDPSENIDMEIFRVSPELYRGQLDVIQSVNPLDKQLSVYYTADFRGTPERWEFQWEYGDPVNGRAPDVEDDSLWHDYTAGAGIHHVTVGDAGVFGLSDHYLRCRYRPLDPEVTAVAGTNWSGWTTPVLCEGWIKRVLKAINPFEQRIRDFMNYAVLTDLSMIQQIGAPYDGDIPLNYEALNENGLAQIYETLNNQANELSVDAGFIASDSLALALLMVRGRLSDLYMVLGHEAYGDAMDPTVNLGADDPVGTGLIPSLFCFENQEPDLLSEELALLRGRDDDMNPPVSRYPVYNRLPWNITADIVGGQVAYLLNYGISDFKGNQNGVLDVEDAQILFPQGHGDAYGYYLSALKGYYDYLHNTNFSWYPQVEGILAGDTEITVSYLHEKKFAVAAAARARAGVAVLRATQRADYEGEESWRTVRDSQTNRAWGVGEWSSRVGMGAYFDWLTANSLLPDQDANPSHDGIRVIDRRTMPELAELVDLGRQVERLTDFTDAGLNPLGVAPDAVPFDISSSEIDAGKTHFEQIYARALKALQNTVAISERVRECSQAIRDQNEAADLDVTIQAEEARITRRLIEIYGYPYADDIGPGKLYAQGYTGPDLLHYFYIDTWPLDASLLSNQRQMNLILTQYNYTTQTNSVALSASQSFISEWFEGASDSESFNIVSAYYQSTLARTVTVSVANNGVPVKPASYAGKRRAEGEIQMALSEYLTAIADLEAVRNEAQQAADDLKRRGDLWLATVTHQAEVLSETVDAQDEIRNLNTAVSLLNGILEFAKAYGEMAEKIGDVAIESIPKVVGLATDATSPARGTIKFAATAHRGVKLAIGVAIKATIAGLQTRITDIQSNLERTLMAENLLYEGLQAKSEILSLLQRQNQYLATIEAQLQRVETARMRLNAAVSEGDQLQIERERLRMNWAADLNVRRYRNMAYRLFQNDELTRYQQSFDWAARYVFLAAKAYDYETGLLESDALQAAGAAFMRQIVKARALGRFTDWTQYAPAEPLVGGTAGDPGLADAMARMRDNWSVLSGRLNFNNPQQETGRFSLRQEFFRITTNTASDAQWRATLSACKVANLRDLPDFTRYCLPFEPMASVEPALVIPFGTTVDFRRNFFGHLLAGGDNAYDSTHFATKIRGVGVWFSGYNTAFADGLANQPRVYLVPAGIDSMRVPIGTTARTRQWSVVDQALPVPYPLSQSEWELPDWSVLQNLLGNEVYRIRRFPTLLAYHDSGAADINQQVTWNSRLIGRSVWNSRWVLIIPGGTLLADPNEGIERFINGRLLPSGVRDGNGVKDIKLYFHTYSYSGN